MVFCKIWKPIFKYTTVTKRAKVTYICVPYSIDFISIFQKVKLALNLLVFLHQQFSMASNKFFILQPSQNVLKNCQTNYCHHHP